MEETGLVVKPEFDNPNRYLSPGSMTQITPQIQKIANVILSNDNITDGQIIKGIIMYMNKYVKRLNDAYGDERKFKRTAQEILESKERTGCCDSATLFRAIAIACKIPTMQIITFSKSNYNNGHFYSGVYLKDIDGQKKWHIIDSDQPAKNMNDVILSVKRNIEDRNIGKDNYSYAYVNDYRDFKVNGVRIDSISNIHKIQKIVYDTCVTKASKKTTQELYK